MIFCGFRSLVVFFGSVYLESAFTRLWASAGVIGRCDMRPCEKSNARAASVSVKAEYCPSNR